ncbi:MAG TPA: glycosyltransferase family 2 protein [Candidatus Baltobacteraceae bacterium]|nr:glycosyltransferase family 2 protein [Candidatus Baltobacteraceae bacterium]
MSCVIPAYRAARTVVEVVQQALLYADEVIVVDDACPEGSGAAVAAAYGDDARVHVVLRSRNGGVGAATKSGIDAALQRGADVIVKLDADGQMDAAFIGDIRELFLENPSLAYVKGNRFFDSGALRKMPKVRFLGNAILSLMAKWASGYWNIIDPTNGYVAFKAPVLQVLDWRSFGNSYFFELSVLCELGLKRLPIAELEMPTIYTSAPSSLSLTRVIFEFPPRLVRALAKRILLQYFIFDVNLGTIYFVVGTLLALFGLIFGGFEWVQSIITNVPRATGTVMLAVLPFLMGFQLLLNALMYDVQFSPRTQHELKVHRVTWPESRSRKQ